jgi:peptidoglycan/xylan/chitin deacetylase (PgdA/CDA1 family)
VKKIILITAIFILSGCKTSNIIPVYKPNPTIIPTITMTPSITPTPTPKPITFADLNKKYGPCVKLPVLMFHHIESTAEAKLNHQTSLAVSPEFFAKDMEYLKTHGYTTIFPNELINFFDKGTALPKKPVMITLDDAYADNYINAFPILKQYGFKATIFTPTGLIQNPDYLNWNEIKEMGNSGLVYFGNHTWSHHSSAGTLALQEKEISLANGQLAEKGQNPDKVFAYPYGVPSVGAEKILTKYGYQLAFTTVPGNIMCKGKRLTLPRTRMGNNDLSHFGL